MTRREFLSGALLLPSLFPQTASARFISAVPLVAPGDQAPPFGRLLGAGLDARLFTDLSQLGAPPSAIRNPQSATRNPTALVTSNDRFYVRTATPSPVRRRPAWPITVAGLVREPIDLAVASLPRTVTRTGPCVMECAGNSDPTNFGLLSAAEWEGWAIGDLIERARPSTGSHRVLVSGIDDAGPAVTSTPGASWVFSADQLSHAVLAHSMNGQPVPSDHGAPVRLVVPGWYGCACIKWVNRIELVADDTPATTQMLEFASRTHQPFDSRDIASSLRTGPTVLARDFIPAFIETAAMPVRVEKWLLGGRLAYRITGIVWGGAKPTNALSIRFKSNQAWVPVDDCPMPASALTWSLWSHVWRPDAPGRYQIVLRVDDPAIRTRRLDIFFYVREIEITEI